MQASQQEAQQVLSGFVPLAALWEGVDESPPLFPSEPSARWFSRVHREELVNAQAIARHRRLILVHPERFARVVEKVALDAA